MADPSRILPFSGHSIHPKFEQTTEVSPPLDKSSLSTLFALSCIVTGDFCRSAFHARCYSSCSDRKMGAQ